MTRKQITSPLHEEDIVNLRAGDQVYLSGIIYTARDAAHARLIGLLQKGEKLPINLTGQIIYYVGPSPAKLGAVIGSAGPTTSYRMDAYTPPLLEQGLKGMIGKGSRSREVKEAIKKYKAVYFAAVGGAAALMAKCVKKAQVVAYADLGPEAIHMLEVENLPVTVVNDCWGGDLYEEGVQRYRQI
ncbi:MAG: Fe-S-containing hydro-lyase [Bacillota bacterium]